MKVLGICFLAVALTAALSSSASATSFTFGDSAVTWAGWTGNYSSTDSVGTPDLLGGYGEISDSGTLVSLSFRYTQSSYAHDSGIPLKAGALFLDGNADGTWDYVVDTLGAEDVNQKGYAGYKLYSVSIPENSAGSYILSQDSANWQCCSIRQNQPVGITTSGLTSMGTVGFSGWIEDLNLDASNPNISTFDFGSSNINLGTSFTISWMPNCANDVIYETIRYNPVPEPGSLVFLGTGIAAIGFVVRRKIKQ